MSWVSVTRQPREVQKHERHAAHQELASPEAILRRMKSWTIGSSRNAMMAAMIMVMMSTRRNTATRPGAGARTLIASR